VDVARAAQALAPRVAPSFLKIFWSLKNWDLRFVWNLIHWSLRFIWPATSSVESNLVLEIRDLNEFIFEKEDL
jgi:hypothetical protein